MKSLFCVAHVFLLLKHTRSDKNTLSFAVDLVIIIFDPDILRESEAIHDGSTTKNDIQGMA